MEAIDDDTPTASSYQSLADARREYASALSTARAAREERRIAAIGRADDPDEWIEPLQFVPPRTTFHGITPQPPPIAWHRRSCHCSYCNYFGAQPGAPTTPMSRAAHMERHPSPRGRVLMPLNDRPLERTATWLVPPKPTFGATTMVNMVTSTGSSSVRQLPSMPSTPKHAGTASWHPLVMPPRKPHRLRQISVPDEVKAPGWDECGICPMDLPQCHDAGPFKPQRPPAHGKKQWAIIW